MLAVLGKASYFTALDLKSGYCQIHLREGTKKRQPLAIIEVCMHTISYHLG